MVRIKDANKANELIEKIRDLQEFVHDWQDEQTFSAPIMCLAEFQRMHRQLCGTVKGFVQVREYNALGMWSIRLCVTKFGGGEMVAKDEVEWDNYCTTHSEEYERENEERLAAFKEKFNLK